MHLPEQSPFVVRRASALPKLCKNEHDDQQHHHADVDDILMVLVLAVVDGKAADAARADRTGHRRQADEADGRHRRHANRAPARPRADTRKISPQRARTHAARGLDLALVHAGQRDLDLARVKRHRAEHQRQNRALHADGRADHRARQRDEENQQDDKRNRAEHVDDDVHNLIDEQILSHAALARDHQQHTEEQADDKRDQPGLAEHLKRRRKAGEKKRSR